MLAQRLQFGQPALFFFGAALVFDFELPLGFFEGSALRVLFCSSLCSLDFGTTSFEFDFGSADLFFDLSQFVGWRGWIFVCARR